MRTTITISDSLMQETLRVSKKKRYSEAVVTSLQDYLDMKKRLAFLEKLYARKLPHSYRTIKAKRNIGTWSS